MHSQYNTIQYNNFYFNTMVFKALIAAYGVVHLT